jgi:hypothetical protein
MDKEVSVSAAKASTEAFMRNWGMLLHLYRAQLVVARARCAAERTAAKLQTQELAKVLREAALDKEAMRVGMSQASLKKAFAIAVAEPLREPSLLPGLLRELQRRFTAVSTFVSASMSAAAAVAVAVAGSQAAAVPSSSVDLQAMTLRATHASIRSGGGDRNSGPMLARYRTPH